MPYDFFSSLLSLQLALARSFIKLFTNVILSSESDKYRFDNRLLSIRIYAVSGA